MNKILVSGATGLIGNFLCELLVANGFELSLLSRGKGTNTKYSVWEWNIQKEWINEQILEQEFDYVIHLAGAGIADKSWTKSRKKEIIDSRVQSMRLLSTYISRMKVKPKAFISASAIGIYGNAGSLSVDEKTPIELNSSDFLVQCCTQWEAATASIKNQGIRTAILRIGIVLSTQGGALSKMLPSYKMGIGSYFGDGQQIYSWVHIEDICRMLLFLVQNEECEGVYNGVAPNPISNFELAKAISVAKQQKSIYLPVPSWGLKLAMGEMASIVLHSAKVEPSRLKEAGYEFLYPEIQAALQHIIKEKL